jgi:hypothetical protein
MSDKTTGDIANRIGLWVGMCALALYVINIGAWVGAADEKFADAETVEQKQDQLILDVNTIQTTQATQTKAIEENKKAIETSRREILDAVAALAKE